MAWNDETINLRRGPVQRGVDLAGINQVIDEGVDEIGAIQADAGTRIRQQTATSTSRGGRSTFEPAEFAMNSQTGEIALPNGQIVKANAPTILQLATLESSDGTPLPRMQSVPDGFRPLTQAEMKKIVDSIPTESDFWGEAFAAGKGTLGLMASAIDSMFGSDDPSNSWSNAQRALGDTQSIGQYKAGQNRWYSSFDSFLSGLGETAGNVGGVVVGAIPVAAAGATAGAAAGAGVGAAPGALLGAGLAASGGAAAYGEQATEFYESALDAMSKMDPAQLERESPLYREVLREQPNLPFEEAIKEVAIRGARVAGATAGVLGAAEGMVGGRLAGNFLTRMGVSKSILGRGMDAVAKREGLGWSAGRTAGRTVLGGAAAAGEEMAESMLGQAAGAAYTGVGSTDPLSYANADEGWAAALGGGIFGALGGRSRSAPAEVLALESPLGVALTSTPDTNQPWSQRQELSEGTDLIPAALRRQDMQRLPSPGMAAPTPDQRAQVQQQLNAVLSERFGPSWAENIDRIAQDPAGRQLVGQLIAIEQDIQAERQAEFGAPAAERGYGQGPVDAGRPFPIQQQMPLEGGYSAQPAPPPAPDQRAQNDQRLSDIMARTLEQPPPASQGDMLVDRQGEVPMNLSERRLAQQMRQQEMAQMSQQNPQALPARPSRTIEQEIFAAEDEITQLEEAIAQRPKRDPRLKFLRQSLREAKATLADAEARWQEARLVEGPQGVAPEARVDAPEPVAAPADRTPDGRPVGVAPAPLPNPEPMSPEEAAARAQTQAERGTTPQAATPAAVEQVAASSDQQVSPSTPEPAADIAVQVEAMVDPATDRDAVFVAEGNEQQMPTSLPKGVRKVTRAGVGTLLTTNPTKATQFRTKPNLTDRDVQRLLGYSQSKADALRRGGGAAPVVVQARTSKGVAAEQIVAPADVPAAKKSLKRQAPKGATIVETTPEQAQQRRSLKARESKPKAKKSLKKTAADDERTEGPSEAQIEAGNYPKRRERIDGLEVSIETEAGQKRRPEWPPLKHAYGYIKRSLGKDGEQVDVFLGPRAADTSLPVFVVDQNTPGGRFDEHKVMLGFADEAAARAGYLANYTQGWQGLGGITQLSWSDFKTWVRDANKTRQRAERSASDVATVTDRAKGDRTEQAPAATADTVERASVRKAETVAAAGKAVRLPERMTRRTGQQGSRIDLRVDSIDEEARFAVGRLLEGGTLTASDRAKAEAAMRDFDQLETMLDAAVVSAEDRLRAVIEKAPDGVAFTREAEKRQLEVERSAAAGERGRPRTKPRTSPLAYLPLVLSESRGFLKAVRAESKAELAAGYTPSMSVARHMISAITPQFDEALQGERTARSVLQVFANLSDAQLETMLQATHQRIADATVAKQVMRGATEVAHAIRRMEQDITGNRTVPDFADHRIEGVDARVQPHATEHGAIPEGVAGVVNEWVSQFEKGGNKFSAPVHVMSVKDAMRLFPGAFVNGRAPNGKFIRRTDAKGNPTDYILAVDWARFPFPGAALEVLAHEYGHMVTTELYARTDPRSRRAIDLAYDRWLTSQHGRSVDDILRDQMPGAERLAFTGGATNRAYATDFWEWAARNAALYLMDPARPHLTAVEKFFKAIADALRQIYQKVTGVAQPSPAWAEALDRWIDGTMTLTPMPRVESAAFNHDAFADAPEPPQNPLAKRTMQQATNALAPLRGLFTGQTTVADVRETMDPLLKGKAMDRLKSLGLSLMTMRQIERQYRDTKLGPALSGWVRNQQLKAQTANRALETGSQWMERANLLDAKVRGALERIMYEATHFGIHPDLPLTDPKNAHLLRGSTDAQAANAKRYTGLRNQWDAVMRADPKAAEIYAGLRDAFAELHTKTLEKLQENIETSNISAGAKKKILDRVTASMREMREGPYFPLMRFGDWRVTVQLPSYFVGAGGKESGASFPTKTAAREEMRNQRALNPGARVEMVADDGGGYRVGVFQRGVYFFETQAQAEAATADIEREVREHYDARGVSYDDAQEALKSKLEDGSEELIISPAKPSNDARNQSRTPPTEFVNEVRALVANNKIDAEVAAVLEQLAVEALPENSYRQAMLPRQNIFGASKQMLRAYAHRFQGAAHHYSVVEHGKAINKNWQTAWEVVNAGYADGGRVLNMLKKNQEAVAERTKSSTRNVIMNTITDASSLYSLGFSPAYVLTNSLQPWVITLPTLAGLTKRDGGSVGITKATKYLKEAYSGAMPFFSKRGIGDFVNEARALAGKRGSDVTLQDTAKEIITRFGKTEGEQRMLESLLERGTLDFAWLNSLEDAMRGGAVGQKWANLQRLGMALPQQVEAMNRVVSALAAYRLAKEERLTDGSESSLQQFADDTVAETQLDYSRMNRPLAFNTAGLNIMLQFKLYMQGMYMLFARNAALAMRGATPEERKQGRRTVAYLLAAHAAAAGAAGLGPVAGMAKLSLWTFAAIAGDEDDEWKSGEQLMHEMLTDLFGEYAGTVVERGLPAVLGVDMSDRLGIPVLADERFANIRESDNTGQTMDKWLIYSLGAPYSNAKRVVTGVADTAKGNFGYAINGLPSGARAVARSAKWAAEGVIDRDGDTFIPRSELGWADLTISTLGLAPLTTSRAYAERTETKQTMARIVNERKRLMQEARTGDDVSEEIKAFNASAPRPFRITSEQLSRSRSERAKREAGELRRDEAAVKKLLGQ